MFFADNVKPVEYPAAIRPAAPSYYKYNNNLPATDTKLAHLKLSLWIVSNVFVRYCNGNSPEADSGWYVDILVSQRNDNEDRYREN